MVARSIGSAECVCVPLAGNMLIRLELRGEHNANVKGAFDVIVRDFASDPEAHQHGSFGNSGPAIIAENELVNFSCGDREVFCNEPVGPAEKLRVRTASLLVDALLQILASREPS